MQLQIFDVAHGFCAYVVADNGNTMLIDCGRNEQTGFEPGQYLASHSCTAIERFFVLNYDEDHLSGLPNLLALSQRVPIRILNRNPTISPDQLRTLKLESGLLGSGITALLEMLQTYTAPVTVPPYYVGLEYEVFYNSYPRFRDTNNLSQVVFLHFPGLSIVFPGDLEKAGWRALLSSSRFQENLRKINIFVASHHGRDSGYAPEVFQVCSPDIIVISDEAVRYETQETAYSNHSKGIRWSTGGVRKVLTTRQDGMIVVTSGTGQPYRYHIQTSR
jgi:beta-lactamase superfamily II metal-dependent hydrolase